MNVRDLVPWGRNDRMPAMTGADEPANPILTLHREMNRMFDDVLRGFDMPFGSMSRMSGPSVAGLHIPDAQHGRFERRVTLPDADEARAQASFRDGLLTVTLPKSERAQEKVRRIPINDGSATTH